ncbi:MAG: UPF0175 family protein, partial [Campylobacterota bacterium]|nr:UPF0175 family protein [Campylobacterota bacterium]
RLKFTKQSNKEWNKLDYSIKLQLQKKLKKRLHNPKILSDKLSITIPLNDDTLSIGIKNVVALEQYRDGLISLGKMAEFLSISKTEAMSLLGRLGIDWLEYDRDELEEQVSSAQRYAKL